MTHSDFENFVRSVQEKEFGILTDRGRRYSSHDDDRLGQFKQIARIKNTNPIEEPLNLSVKQYSALWNTIFMWIKGERGNVAELEEYVMDIRNYLLLLLAIAHEQINPQLSFSDYLNRIRREER